MKFTFPVPVFLVALALPAVGLRAEGPPRAGTPPPAIPTMPRSNFNAPAENSPAARNPFVPIGYVRPAAAAVKEKVPIVTAEQFVVTSYSIEPPPLAVINGRTYGIGERIPVDKDGTEFVTVRQIRDGVVVLDHRGRTLECRSKPKGR